MRTSKFRYNRAVDAHNKGDVFEADSNSPQVQALLGAGYADPVFEDKPEVWAEAPDYTPAHEWEEVKD